MTGRISARLSKLENQRDEKKITFLWVDEAEDLEAAQTEAERLEAIGRRPIIISWENV